jgi:hypothetical protein
MYFIGLDVHKRTISYCVKDAAGHVHQEGKIGSTRRELDSWIKSLPQPRMIAMEATIFTGWIYDRLLPHAEKVKVAHPLMLRAIAAAKKKNDKIDAGKIALSALRFPAAVPYGLDGDPEPPPHVALPEPGAKANGTDEEPCFRAIDGDRGQLQQAVLKLSREMICRSQKLDYLEPAPKVLSSFFE